MALKNFLIVFPLAFAAFLVPAAEGVKCFACNYTNVIPWYMPLCDDPFQGTTADTEVQECDGVCVKESGSIYYDGGEVNGLARFCKAGISVNDEACSNACGSQGRLAGCNHCCDTDFCNGADSLTFNLLAATATLALSLLWRLLAA